MYKRERERCPCLFDDLWEDDFTNIVPQFRFELETALVVE